MPFYWAPDDNCELPTVGVRVKRILPALPVPVSKSEDHVIISIVSVTIAIIIVIGLITVIMHWITHRKLDEAKRDRTEKEPEGQTDRTRMMGVPYMRTRTGLYTIPNN